MHINKYTKYLGYLPITKIPGVYPSLVISTLNAYNTLTRII